MNFWRMEQYFNMRHKEHKISDTIKNDIFLEGNYNEERSINKEADRRACNRNF